MLDLRLPVRSRTRPDDPDPESVRLVQETRRRRLAGLTRRDRWASIIVGGGFLAAAVPFALMHESTRSPGWATVIALIAAYTASARVEFDVIRGTVVPTELVLVPMLFLLPLGWVPLAVATGMILSRVPEYVRGRVPVQQVGLRLVSSWHAMGPALVLAAAGESGADIAGWKLYTAALAAQFVFDLAGVLHELIAGRAVPRAEFKLMGVAYAVDAALAPLGLLAALAALQHSLYFLLVMPLIALLAAFAAQRRTAIESAAALGSAYRSTAELLVDFLEDADAYTGDHSNQIANLVLEVADELGINARGRRNAELAALLHDVGKMRIPRELIIKPARLTPAEKALMETHTIEGEKILARADGGAKGLLADVGAIVRSCHERWDGKGYPDGKAGEEIPLVARIVACCDAYNAMTTDRPYRLALDEEDALYELRVHAGTQFDPAVVDALVRVLARQRLSATA